MRWRHGRVAAVLVGLGLGCGAGPQATATPHHPKASEDQMTTDIPADLRRRMAPDEHASAWGQVTVPGAALFALSSERSRRGAAVIHGRVLLGAEAFQALRELGVTSAPDLAALAALFLESPEGGAEILPGPEAARASWPDRAELVEAPRVDGGTLVYWRVLDRPRDLVRVRVDLATGRYEHARAENLRRDEAIADDPIAVARRDLAAPSKYVQANGVAVLEKCGDPRAAELLVDTMEHSQFPSVREAALRAQVRCPAPDTPARVAKRLQVDPDRKVRRAAAETLGALGAPEGRAALEAAASGDADGDVRSAARRALQALGG